MARYTAIADAGKALLEMLKDKIVPEPLSKPENIGLCEPKERGAYTVGIHLYDIKESAETKRIDPVRLPNGDLQNPPLSVQLYYMVSVSSKAELDTKASDEARIIGRVMQSFMDNPIIPYKYLPDSIRVANQDVTVNMLNMELEEKVKVWTMFGESYKVSMFYSVGPIYIDSEVIKVPARKVSSVQLGSTQTYKEYNNEDIK